MVSHYNLAMISGVALLWFAVLQTPPLHEPTGCGSNIVSATVVATFCGHREGDAEMLDLLILWRGRPGWFQRRFSGDTGSRGSHTMPFGGNRNGSTTEYTTYEGVTIGYEADFDARVVTVEKTVFKFDEGNAVLVDHVDDAAARHVAGHRRIPARLPLAGDMNVSAIRRSAALVTFLQCGIPMPEPRARGRAITQPQVVTVCEKLRK